MSEDSDVNVSQTSPMLVAPPVIVEGSRKRKSRFEAEATEPIPLKQLQSSQQLQLQPNKWDMFAEADTPVDNYNVRNILI